MSPDVRLELTVQVLLTSFRLLRSGCFTAPAMLANLPASGWRLDEVESVLDFLVGRGTLRVFGTAKPETSVYFAGPNPPPPRWEPRMTTPDSVHVALNALAASTPLLAAGACTRQALRDQMCLGWKDHEFTAALHALIEGRYLRELQLSPDETWDGRVYVAGEEHPLRRQVLRPEDR